MRVVSLLVLSAALSACSANSSTNNTMNVDENLTTTDMNETTADINATSPAAAPVPKVHNYEDRDGKIYEYVSAVSEEDAKKGVAVGDVELYAFRGVSNGLYRISGVDDGGHTRWSYECTNPCGVIKVYEQGQLVKRYPYEPRSVIGSVFEDAFNGFLEVSKEPRTFRPSTYAAPTTPYYPSSPPATTEPQEPDANNNGS